MDVPAENFKKCLGATGVRYIPMGQANHVQENKEWNLEETIRQGEQKYFDRFKGDRNGNYKRR